MRCIPVPSGLLVALQRVHQISVLQADRTFEHMRIWPWGRTTAWKHIKSKMNEAGIYGPQACAKGLRHGFAVSAIQSGVPITLVSKWLGHSKLSTTAIYADAIGPEEREIAKRMWSQLV